MPTTTAGEIMDKAAALLNDTAKQVYTYTVQFPYLQMALQELTDEFHMSNMPVTNLVSAVIPIAAGTTSIGLDTSPALPADLIDIQTVWERAEGINPYTEMDRKEFIPESLEGVEPSAFGIYSWRGNTLNFRAANRDNDIKLNYLGAIFSSVIDQNSVLGILNGKNYLQYKTAALMAHFIGENPTRSTELHQLAAYSLSLLQGTDAKSKQGMPVRRKGFRRGYKMMNC